VRLVWTTSAKRDLAEIVSYIWFDSPDAAKRIRRRIEATATYLTSHPWMGRQGSIADTREAIPHPSYRMVYRVTEQTIFILRIVHTSRQWPPAADDETP
jgi:toxin ParE1/3/4